MTDLAPSALRPQHPVPRSLSGLVDDVKLELRGDAGGLELTGVSLSSRSVQPGDLFVGVPGSLGHGASYAAAARDAGAVAVLTDEAGALLAADCGLPLLVTPDVRAALGAVSGWVHRSDQNPATLFAVTWLGVGMGMAAKSVETASNLPLILTLLPFLGSGFVPTESMPAGLQWFADYQPFTPMVETLRGLLLGTPLGGNAVLAVGWCVVITIIGYVWSMTLYERKSVR